MNLPLRIRPACAGDKPYIVGNWVKELRHAGFSKFVPGDLYWPAQHALCDKQLGLGQAAVACHEDNPDHIYGTVVWQPARTPILHWLHVKSTFRRLGVARQLRDYAFPANPPIILCLAAPNWSFSNETLCKALGLVYFPYALMGIHPAKEMTEWPENKRALPHADP